jgi:hypothetical protein
MLEIEKLRKADIFSGSAIMLLGLFIISQGVQMPMKDSYAGVKNVWYVSPALFPLFVGSMLALLGLMLLRTALKSIGVQGLKSVFAYLASPDFIAFLKLPVTIRFYGIVLNLIVFVFILIPRIDFFFAAILFLTIFFFMFYFGGDELLPTLIYLLLSGTTLFSLFHFTGLSAVIEKTIPFPSDLLVLLMILALITNGYLYTRTNTQLARKFRISLIIAITAPFTIGIIFKYFLLVPMPFEGLVVSLLDAIWYADIWS